jgi:hypothetical protein
MEGAVLVLPNGASRENLRFRHNIQEYARQNAVSWCQHVYGTLGLEAEAGPLYLITGHDKCDNWCVASYTDISTESGVSLTFTPTAGGTSYSSEASGAIDTRTFTPRGDIQTNQCAFIRGYRLTPSKSLIERILMGPVKISDIVPPNSRNVAEGEVGRISGAGAISRMFPWFSSGGNRGEGHSRLAEPQAGPSDMINVESFPLTLTVSPYTILAISTKNVLISHTIRRISSIHTY